jgi:hypothetical protein
MGEADTSIATFGAATVTLRERARARKGLGLRTQEWAGPATAVGRAPKAPGPDRVVRA